MGPQRSLGGSTRRIDPADRPDVDLRICEIKIGNHPRCGPGRRGWGAERSSGATGASGIEASTTGRPVGETRRLSCCSWDRVRDGAHVILACAVIVAFEAHFFAPRDGGTDHFLSPVNSIRLPPSEAPTTIEQIKRHSRFVMARWELLPVAFVAILGLAALYALSNGPVRQ